MKAGCIQGRGWFEQVSPPNVGGASNVAYPVWLEVVYFRALPGWTHFRQPRSIHGSKPEAGYPECEVHAGHRRRFQHDRSM